MAPPRINFCLRDPGLFCFARVSGRIKASTLFSSVLDSVLSIRKLNLNLKVEAGVVSLSRVVHNRGWVDCHKEMPMTPPTDEIRPLYV